MFVILGASGHVGGAAVTALRDAGEPVIAVIHDDAKAAALTAQGAEPVVVDVGDSKALRAVFRRGRRAFLLNPPADVSGDIDWEERRTADAVVAALDGSGLEKVVAASTYGAQPGASCGDLTSLHHFEQALAAQPIPAAINRGAYYFTNWDMMLEAAKGGILPTMFPAETKLPMVSPADLGRAAARRLRDPVADIALWHVEGPARLSPSDVAAAFARALDREVAIEVAPRDQWERIYRDQGFSPEAAASYARMTAVSVDGDVDMPDDPVRGTTTIDRHVAALVARVPS